MGKRTVWLGKKRIGTNIATHWAVKVGDEYGYWFEIDGAGKDGNGVRNSINGGYPGEPYWGDKCKKVVEENGKLLSLDVVGTTLKSNDQINDFNKGFLSRNPTYSIMEDNCQIYAYDLVQWLTEGACKLPPMESGVGAWTSGSGGYSTTTDGYAGAFSSSGKAGAQGYVFRAEAEGPSAGAEAFCGDTGLGAFANASLGRAEGSLGKYAKVSLEPNLNTGIGVSSDGAFSAKVAGFGFSAGGRGYGVHTPLGSVEACSIM